MDPLEYEYESPWFDNVPKMKNPITSLTSFAKKYNSDIQACIEFPTLQKPVIKILRANEIRGHEAILGMAYDYAFRLILEYSKNKSLDKALYNTIGFNYTNNNKILIDIFNSKSKVNLYDGILDLSIRLSVNEMSYRGNNKFVDLKNEILMLNLKNELKKFVKATLPELEKAKTLKCIYNPVFGMGNIAADGDILIDKTLVDFKAVSILNEKEHLTQLMGYVAMNEISNRFEIDSVALYFPRFEYTSEYKVEDLFKNKKKLINIFEEYLKN